MRSPKIHSKADSEADSLSERARLTYFEDIWNLVDSLVLTMTFINVVLLMFLDSFNPRRSQLATGLISVTTTLLTTKFLGYLRGFDSTGWLISVLMQKGKDMTPFLIVLSSILCGFTVVFHSLFRGVEGDCELTLEYEDDGQQVLEAKCIETSYTSIGMVAFIVFNMAVLGDFDANHFTGSLSPWTSRVIFIFMVLVVTVIALNALIALLGDSYSRVQDNKIANKSMDRAKLIVEYLEIFPKQELKRIEEKTKYFYVLIPEKSLDDNGHIIRGDESEWEGGLNDTKRYIDKANAHLLKQTKAEIYTALNKLESKSEALESKMEALESKMEGIVLIDSKMEALELKVDTKLDEILSAVLTPKETLNSGSGSVRREGEEVVV